MTGYRLEDQIGFILRLAMQRHISLFTDRIEEITRPQFSVLAKLCALGEASQNELGRSIAMDAATIKGVVDRLRARGLVSAEPLATDRRRLILKPTPAGRALFDSLISRALDASAATLSPLDDDEKKQLLELLNRLT
ncbi:MAG: MarR family winged helix-turn-helix transcriptional regulator [Candidatus Puniceispirillales bacterium]